MREPEQHPKPPPPDFYMAAIGRSGSTMLANWLSNPPDRIVFNEPFFLRPGNSRLLRIQLQALDLPVADAEWAQTDESPRERFGRLMGPRLCGRRWAAKEVLCEEHVAMTKAFAPPRVLVSVRNIVDVALSFFEKHRLQKNLHRFGDDWVTEYCLRESSGILDYLGMLDSSETPYLVVRYEDVIGSAAELGRIAEFSGWPGGGEVAANLEAFGRGFEAMRHGTAIAGTRLERGLREVPGECVRSAAMIGERCASYQRRFGYL